jgi:hypothetical protein
MNLAIPAKVFDDHFEVVWTEVVKVDRVYGFGVYEVNHTRFSRDFSDNGNINWGSEPIRITVAFQGGKCSTDPSGDGECRRQNIESGAENGYHFPQLARGVARIARGRPGGQPALITRRAANAL